MKIQSVLTALGTAAALVGCTFGPKWTSPELDVPAQFRDAGVSSGTMADMPWRQVFRDPCLQSLLEDAFNNNRSLEAMQHNVAIAQQYVTMAQAPMFPSVGYNASSSKGQNQAGGANITATGGHTANPGSMAFNASWEIDLWGKNRRGVESAQASAQQAQEELNSMRASILKQITLGYLQLLMLDEQLEIARAEVQSYRESLELFEQQFEAGTANGLQTAAARAALTAAEAQVPELEMEIAQTENALCALAGRAPGHIARRGTLQQFAESVPVAAGIPADAIARRPDVRAKEQALRSANAEIGVAIASYFPSFNLTGAGGYATMDLRNSTIGRTSGWGVGASLTGPLFQGGRLRANEIAKREAFLAAKADYENTVLSALAEISSTLVQRQKLLEVISKEEEAVANYEESLRLAKSRYVGGMASYYEVLDNQRGLFPARRQLSTHRFQYAATIPTLYIQLGGGWQ